MTNIKHFDNPDDAQAFVESAHKPAGSDHHFMTVTATYPGGRFTRTIRFGEVDHQPSDEALTALFAGFNTIFGGKQ